MTMDATDYMAETARLFGRQLADNVADFVNAKVVQALALERDRTDAELAELRDEIVSTIARPSSELVAAELRSLNDRMTRLTATVAELMGGEPATQSLRAVDELEAERRAQTRDPRKPW